ncbi:hypothetical protein PROFUN_13241 [Planoprotostelium fungivorum]|uniref:Core domain-containing protein n=1 Tax=Planoprotostelium fungivorum TaxID=1890364 RepID=A0A2P6N4R7_9EUKA|nr:hypothetical protein PROFUN_13241 [Planoprotostelium fungivorum]
MSAAGRVITGSRALSSRFANRKAAVALSPSAGARLKELLAKKPDSMGIRLGVKRRGCSGLSYTLDYAREKKPADEIVEEHGIKIFIDPSALMTVVGTEMDYVEDHLKSEFVFVNPNAKGSCGCGESFNT